MLQHYVMVALRQARKQKSYTVLNIAGLALGLACVILIATYINFELSFDRFHSHPERIFRLVSSCVKGERSSNSPCVPAAAGPRLKTECPEVESFARLFTYGWRESALVSSGSRQFYEERFFLADAAVFDIFSFEFIRGNPRTALLEPDGIVLTESSAVKYFGGTDPLGRYLSVLNPGQARYRVTGVIKDIPANSHLHFDFLAALASGEQLFWKGFADGSRGGFDFYTYFRLRESGAAGRLAARLPDLVKKHFQQEGWKISLSLQPLTGIHLGSHLSGELEPGNQATTLAFFALTGLVILLAAGLNYVNLATACSLRRTKEAGLRKVVGADRKEIVKQYLGEGVCFAVLAFPLALLMAEWWRPAFNRMVGRPLELFSAQSAWLLTGLLLAAAATGLAAALYPAWAVASRPSARILKSWPAKGQARPLSRHLLIMAQFAISTAFVFMTMAASRQMAFMRAQHAEIRQEDVLVIRVRDEEALQTFPVLKNELRKEPAVLSVTASSALPAATRSLHRVEAEGKAAGEEWQMYWNAVDPDFVKTYGLRLAAGQDWPAESTPDGPDGYLINETAARRLGWAQPAGKAFQLSNQGLQRAGFRPGRIIGVVKDFHFQSLHQPIEPLVLSVTPHNRQYIGVRFRSGNRPAVIRAVQDRWAKVNPARPFEYFFLDEEFARAYRSESELVEVFRQAAWLATLIAMLGVFGLASFKTEQRRKEIGIRKVLGASEPRIVRMLLADFAKPLLAASFIAWGAGYLIMDRWLAGFAFRVDPGWGVYLASALLTGWAALAAISYHSVRAALANPLVSIRYE